MQIKGIFLKGFLKSFKTIKVQVLTGDYSVLAITDSMMPVPYCMDNLYNLLKKSMPTVKMFVTCDDHVIIQAIIQSKLKI